MYKNFDFQCTKCAHEFEDLIDVRPNTDRKDVSSVCPKCGSKALSLFSVASLATFSLMSPEARKEHLRERSEAHTKKYLT